jgi:chromosome segregation ATPase
MAKPMLKREVQDELDDANLRIEELEDELKDAKEELEKVSEENELLESKVADLENELDNDGTEEEHIKSLITSCKNIIRLVHKSQIFKEPLDSIGMARQIQDIEELVTRNQL